MRRLMRFIPAMLAATLLMSCQSAKVEFVPQPVVPELVFPVFPALEDAKRTGDGTVAVSEDWIVRLAEFKIRFEETEKNYNELKALYEGKEKKNEEENF